MSSDVKLLSCGICSKRFKFSSTYKIHINKHKKHNQLVILDQAQSFDGSRHEDSDATKNTSTLDNPGTSTVEVEAGPSHKLTDTNRINYVEPGTNQMEVDYGPKKNVKKNRKISKQSNKDGDNEIISKNTSPTTNRKANTKLNKIFACKICQKLFSSKHSLNRHKNTTHLDVRYECDLCELSYTSKYSLKTHLMWHQNMKPWQCSICGAQFLQNGHYRRHLKIHSDIKEEVCEQCGKRFRDKDALRIHKQTHAASLRFQCSVCNVKLKLKSSLRNHMKLHEKQKEFTCVLCNRSFTQKKCYLNHVRLHKKSCSDRQAYIQPIREFCELCHKGFAKKSGLQKHMKKHELGLLKRFNSMKLQEPQREMSEKVTTLQEISEGQQCEKSVLSPRPRNSLKNFLQVTNDKDMESIIKSGLQSVAHTYHAGANNSNLSNPNDKVSFPNTLDISDEQSKCSIISLDKAVDTALWSQTDLLSPQDSSNKQITVVNKNTDNDKFASSRQESDVYTSISDKSNNQSIEATCEMPAETRNKPINSSAKFNDDDIMNNNKDINKTSKHAPELVNVLNVTSSNNGEGSLNNIAGSDKTSICTSKQAIKADDSAEVNDMNCNDDNNYVSVNVEKKSLLIQQCSIMTDGQTTNKTCNQKEFQNFILSNNTQNYRSSVNNESEMEDDLEDNFDKCLRNHSNNMHKTVTNMPKQYDEETEGRHPIDEATFNIDDRRIKSNVLEMSNVKGKKTKAICEYCGKGFSRKQSMNIHLHQKTCIKSFQCNLCSKSFVTKARLRKHQEREHNIRYMCGICNKSYVSHFKLKKHLKHHVGGSSCVCLPKIYICHICDKKYTASSTLKQHLLKHKGVKFNCVTCDAVFSQKSHLRRHTLSVHLGVKSFKCDMEGCDKAFIDSQSLEFHTHTHKGVKSYQCEQCGKCFSDPGNLKVHRKTHLNIKDFRCDVCQQEFSTKMSMLRHAKRHLLETSFGHTSHKRRVVKKMAEKSIVCVNGCDKKFTTKRAMIAHSSKQCPNRVNT